MPDPVRFRPSDLITLYGALTVTEIAERIEKVVLLRCGKLHEEEFTPFKVCPNFSTNILCEHCNAIREGSGRVATLRSATSLVATALRVSHELGRFSSLETTLEEPYQLGTKLHSIDGGAFIAYRELFQPVDYSFSFLPRSYRRPEWEKLALPELRAAVQEAEGALEPEAGRILDFAREGLKLASLLLSV